MNVVNYKSPLYIQLREVIRSKIEDGEYAPGTAIPSENQLAELYGLNRLSVRSALSALEYEGLLKSVTEVVSLDPENITIHCLARKKGAPLRFCSMLSSASNIIL